jgi:hypothetical protein
MASRYSTVLSLCFCVRNYDLRAGVDFPDAFVLDPIMTAQAVRGAEGLVTLAARVLLHLLCQERREGHLRQRRLHFFFFCGGAGGAGGSTQGFTHARQALHH